MISPLKLLRRRRIFLAEKVPLFHNEIEKLPTHYNCTQTQYTEGWRQKSKGHESRTIKDGAYLSFQAMRIIFRRFVSNYSHRAVPLKQLL